MRRPLISVIIPAYNAEKTIHRTLESILNQTYSEYEVILVDDGSTDLTKDIFIDYVGEDSRFFYYYQPNNGQGSARNRALEYAKGEFFCFIDSDDSVSKNYFEKLLDKAIKTNADIVLSDFVEINEETELSIKKTQQYQGGNKLEKIFPTYSCKLWNADFFKKCNIVQPSIKFEDIATAPYCICKAKKIVSAEGCTYNYYQRSDSTVMQVETFSHRQLATKMLCDLFVERGDFNKYRDELLEFLKIRFFADVSRYESVSYKIYDDLAMVIKEFFEIDPNSCFIKTFIWGSYNIYRSSKYIIGNKIIHRYMATTVESVVSLPYKKLCEKKIVREPILRQENVINDISKRYMGLNPVECEEVGVFLLDLLDERFNVGVEGEERFTISDAFLDKEEELPNNIINITDRMSLFEECIEPFLRKMKIISDGKKVIMVRMLLAEKYGNEIKRNNYNQIKKIREINQFLNKMYDIVEKRATWITMIEVDKYDEYYTDENFRYGCYPWHLNEEMYSIIGKKIQEIING